MAVKSAGRPKRKARRGFVRRQVLRASNWVARRNRNAQTARMEYRFSLIAKAGAEENVSRAERALAASSGSERLTKALAEAQRNLAEFKQLTGANRLVRAEQIRFARQKFPAGALKILASRSPRRAVGLVAKKVWRGTRTAASNLGQAIDRQLPRIRK